MACDQLPSVTLWGTTQITTTTTFISTYTQLVPQPPIITLDGKTLTTTTPTQTFTLSSQVVKPTVITQVVPQKTLFYPCSTTDTSNGGTSLSDPTFSSLVETIGASLFSGAVSVTNTFAPPSSQAASTSSLSQAAPVSSTSAIASSGYATASLSSESFTLPAPSTSYSPGPGLSTAASSADIISSSSVSTEAAQNASSGSSNHHSWIIGAAVGGAFVLAFMLWCLWCWGKRRHESSWATRTLETNEDYWERRFRALESGVEKGEEGVAGVQGGEEADPKKIRVRPTS